MQARVNVPDDRYLWLLDLYKPKSQVSAFLEVVDIAGLVKCALSRCTALLLVYTCPCQSDMCTCQCSTPASPIKIVADVSLAHATMGYP